jgi:hypothetical protein
MWLFIDHGNKTSPDERNLNSHENKRLVRQEGDFVPKADMGGAMMCRLEICVRLRSPGRLDQIHEDST